MFTPFDLMKIPFDLMQQSLQVFSNLVPEQAIQDQSISVTLARIAHGVDKLVPRYPDEAPSLSLKLLNSTQGPFWPPSEFVDQDGNFIVVGALVTGSDPPLVPGQAMIVSKDTVPPLKDGREDFDNLYAAPYKVLRHLDLRPGSKDLDLELHTLSYGPRKGNFGGEPRVPKAGDTHYNLYYLPPLNPNLFPLPPEDTTYTRPSFSLHRAPIWGLTNDLLVHEVEAGVAIDPGSQGVLDRLTFSGRRHTPITLGRWLQAQGTLQITLIRYDQTIGAYTGARFDFAFAHLLPHSVYDIFVIRADSFLPISSRRFRLGEPLGLPNFFITNGHGEARISYEVKHPFPDLHNTPPGFLRILGIGVSYKSDYQNWGAEDGLLAFGVSTHIVFNTFQDGKQDFTSFITKEPAS